MGSVWVTAGLGGPVVGGIGFGDAGSIADQPADRGVFAQRIHSRDGVTRGQPSAIPCNQDFLAHALRRGRRCNQDGPLAARAAGGEH